MHMKNLAAGAMLLCPMVVLGAGSHSGGHDDHASPAAQPAMQHHHDEGHAHASNADDHHAGMGHASVVGEPARAAEAGRTINVDLLDTMRFAFDTPLQLKRGEVIRFVVSNRGQIRHEFSIGSEAEQDAHRAMMRDMPNMVHQDPNAVTVEPGETRVLTWRFDGEHPVVVACNIPGHAEAGMVATTMLSP